MVLDRARDPSRPIPLGRDDVAALRQLVRVIAARSPDAARKLMAFLDGLEPSSSGWRFTMVGDAEDEAVAYWIADNARRKGVASKLWASCKRHRRNDTGEVLMDRREMVRRVGAPSPHISQALAELASIGALERHGTGRDVRWFVSAKLSTKLTGAARDQAQQDAPPLLAPIQGGAVSP